MEVEDDGTIVLTMIEVQTAIVWWLSGRGLVEPSRPYKVVFDVAVFDNDVVARVSPGTHG